MSSKLSPGLLARNQAAAEASDVSDWPGKIRLLVDSCHPPQRDFVSDPGRHVAALVGGRGGKTTGSKGRILKRMMSTPNARVRYFATTRSHAEDLMWVPLKETCEAIGLKGLEWNETKLRLKFPQNGATLWLVGCDNRRAAEVHRGLPSHEVIIDEAGSFEPRLLSYLIDQVITPRLGDYRGTLVLIGTPSVQQGSHRFFEVTRTNSKLNQKWGEADEDWEGWSLHTWSLQDGAVYVPEMANAWELAQKTKELNGWTDDHPVWRREYLGHWAADDTDYIYRYRSHKDGEEWNQWDPPRIGPYGMAQLPPGHDWMYVYGCDLGYGDDFAECVFAFSPTSKDLLHVYEFGGQGMYPKRIAEHLLGEELKASEPEGLLGQTGWPAGHVADSEGLGQGYLDELRDVYGIFVKKAEKKDKAGSIELFNGDLIEGRIKILKGSKLEEQLLSLQWHVDDYGRLKERPGDRNDFTDAALYARREAHHQFASSAEPPKPKGQDATIMRLNMAEERLAEESVDEFGDDPWTDYTDDVWD